MINQVSFRESQTAWQNAYDANTVKAPFLTWQWHDDWYRVLSDGWTEYTLSTDDGIIAPFARKESTVIFSGGDEIADYLDIIGPADRKQSAWEQIIAFLQPRGVSQMLLRNIPAGSPTIEALRQKGASLAQEDTTPVIRLPNSWDEYLGSLSKKYRHELERKMRKFQREHIDAQIVESVNPARDIGILFSLMQKDEEKNAFLTDTMKTFFTRIAETFSRQIKLSYISLGDKHISAVMAFEMDNAFFLYNSGFDKECCNIAGFYLKAMTIQSAIQHGVTTYNFLQGNERYKFELGGTDSFVYSARLSL